MICTDFRFGLGQSVELAAFAHAPMDARSACIAAVQGTTAADVAARVAACRDLGAPAVIALTPTHLQLWRQGEQQPALVDQVPTTRARSFFQARKEELAPEAVFRAKTWGRFDREFQLSFVDAGLMPVIEAEIGAHLTSLIERVVRRMRQTAWPRKPSISSTQGHWLLKSAFWLLAAKILRDKRVPGFISVDLGQTESVFKRVARHYGSHAAASNVARAETRRQRDALVEAAAEIDRFSHLGNATTESLAHVYESALITKETRASLGTHSTPQYLVDYMVWKLAPWIREIPVDERDVFEPACGHAAFLVASMRLLREFLPADWKGDRQRYLREHLHGVEIDPFALEIARLSLTLADIPNPNGWDLVCGDVFTDPNVRTKAAGATILLGNPPFERFSREGRETYEKQGASPRHVNKAAEVLDRVLPWLRIGGVFGFVVPQGVLHSKEATDLRESICRDFEIQEICLFPDKVFCFSGAESAIILGRRVSQQTTKRKMRYARVREPDMDGFRLDYVATRSQLLSQVYASADNDWNLRLPELPDVWDALRTRPCLKDLAGVGKGFDYKGRELPEGAATVGIACSGARKGFAKFNVTHTHELPELLHMNLSPSVVATRRTGTTTGIPQVLLNYHPVARGPWRLKALIDRRGHPVTSSFITVRPRSPDMPLEYIWAVLNSPLANAYVYAHSLKRDVLVGLMQELPVPSESQQDVERVAQLARAYLDCVRQGGKLGGAPLAQASARHHLLAVDAEVLRLYNLSPKHERELLDVFTGHPRAGVPFEFDRYFPDDFEPWLHLNEYLSEDFQRSTAGALREAHRDIHSPELDEALRRAVEDFEE